MPKSSKKSSPPAPSRNWEPAVTVTPIAKGLVRLDIQDAEANTRACAVLTQEQAKVIETALAKA